MSWTHTICDECYQKLMDQKNWSWVPVRLKEEYRKEDTCCYCGQTHKSGIFVRDDLTNTPNCRCER